MGPNSGDSAASLQVDHLFRRQAGRMVSHLTRVFGFDNIDLVEDSVQDAMVQALRRWPYHGVPDDPMGWILRVARNRAVDVLRRRGVWVEKVAAFERSVASLDSAGAEACFAAEVRDDQLAAIFACCHPVLDRDARVALTLKVVCGFSVAEAAAAFLVTSTTMAQRLVRAKRRLRERSVKVEVPDPGAVAERLDSVLEVVYLTFNAGYATQQGEQAVRHDLAEEAIRLAVLLAEHPVTATPRADALAALLWFHGSRLESRVDRHGRLVLLAPNPVTELNRAIAVAEVEGAQASLTIVDRLIEGALAAYPPAHLARGELLRRVGRPDEASSAWNRAAVLGVSRPVERYLSSLRRNRR